MTRAGGIILLVLTGLGIYGIALGLQAGAATPRLNAAAIANTDSSTFVTAQMFGAKCDGNFNDAGPLSRALASGKNVRIDGHCLIIGMTLAPVSGQRIVGFNNADLSYDGSARCLFEFSKISHVHIEGIIFRSIVSPNATTNPPICANTVADVWVTNNRTVGTCLFETNRSTGYAEGGLATLNYDLHITNNNVGNDTTLPTIGCTGIALFYYDRAEVSGNVISGTLHGIDWWGGDANPSADGAIKNIRWAQNGKFSTNTIHDVAGGCLWGSMGQDNIIVDNIISNCGDTGFDDEGGVRNSFIGGSCKNADNGCLTTFFYPVATLFRNIQVWQSDPNKPFYRSYNSSLDPKTTSVTIESCAFNYTGAGVGVADTNHGPVGRLAFSGNILNNTKIYFASSNQHSITVQGNHLIFTNAAPSSFNMIDIEHTYEDGATPGEADILENVITSNVKQPSGTYAIAVVQTDLNEDTQTLIQGNRSYVPGDGNGDIHISSMSSQKMNYKIIGNQMSAYKRTELGVAKGFAILIGNHRPNSLPFPSPADIGSTYWDVGQQFLYPSASSGSFAGETETVAGAPGSQKPFTSGRNP